MIECNPFVQGSDNLWSTELLQCVSSKEGDMKPSFRTPSPGENYLALDLQDLGNFVIKELGLLYDCDIPELKTDVNLTTLESFIIQWP